MNSHHFFHSRLALCTACLALWFSPAQPLFAQHERVARYSVRMDEGAVPRLHVSASVPIRGNLLTMERTRPGDIPELLNEGWPVFVRNLHITDEAGRSVGIKARRTSGWELERARNGWLNLAYDVDYSLPASLGWPAPREGGFKDSAHFVLVGRSLFITTPQLGPSLITFDLAHPWKAVPPWAPAGQPNLYSVDSTEDLTTNLIVLTRSEPVEVTAGAFRVRFIPMGHWLPASADVKRVLEGVIPQFVKLMRHDDSAYYSIVLLPILEYGGEAYRSSFAMTVDVQPSRSNVPRWGHTLAHEIFHYWNGFRLRGADYASSQWFQEGITEYISDLAMVNSGLIDSDDFREQLARYIRNYEKLTTPLDAPGTSKGPPLYSAGALVAFCWDVQMRAATAGKHTVADFLGNLWRQTEAGRRPYTWDDIRASLESTARDDWNSFYRDYIKGTKKLSLADVFSRAGLTIVRSGDSIAVKQDPEASTDERSVWQGIVQGR